MRAITGRSRLEGPGEGRVQSCPLAGEQVVVDRLLEEGVAKHVALDPGGRVGDEDLPADAFTERVVEGDLIERRGGGEQLGIDPLSGGRRHAEELLGGFGEVRDPAEEDIAKRGWQLAGAVLAGGDEQLLGEERVPAGPGVDRFEERRVEVSTRDRPELLDRLAVGEREELDALDSPAALELGDERQQRVAAVELVGAVGEQQHDRAVAQVADQEAEQVTGRPIGPVKVLDDEQQRAPLGYPGQDPEQELEQAALRRPDAQR